MKKSMKSKIRIGEYILNYRKKQGMTQEELGALLGVSGFAVSKWERELCYPDIFLLPEISNLIGVSIDQMMGMGACSESFRICEEK